MKPILLACILALATPGCAAVMSILPTVVSIVTDAIMILDQIDSHVGMFFKTNPDEVAMRRVAQALGKARAALNALNRVAQGVEAADDQRLTDAFEAFRQAYSELLEVVRPFGVQTQSGAFQVAAAGVLYVPQPLAMQAQPRLR